MPYGYPWQAWVTVAGAAALLAAVVGGLLSPADVLTAAVLALSPDPARRYP